MTSERFNDKVVVITGSSAGIGQDAALEFGKEGASVVIHGQSIERLQQTKVLLKEAGVSEDKILVVVGSMDQPGTPTKIINETIKKFGKIDVLINNAGASSMSGCADPDSLDNLDFLFKVNFRSAIEMTLLAIPHLEKTKGNVVNVSSVSSVRSFAPVTYYSALKAALDHFTRNYAHKYGPKGIRFNTINPGPISTNIVQRHGTTDTEKEEVQKGFNQWAVETTALQRVGSTSEVSTLLKFLASSESSYITGASVLVDGGFNAVSMPMNFLG